MDAHPATRRRYPSDLSDTAWARIAGFLVAAHPRGGRPCPELRWREYVNAILYVAATGCPWRQLPHDFSVDWSATHKRFLAWTRCGVWTRVLAAIRTETRTRAGRSERPSGTVVDSSSVKGTPVPGPRGFDGAKKVDGIKRHIIVDTTGTLVAAHVTAGDVQDRAAFAALLTEARRVCPTVSKIWADKGYTGAAVASACQQAGVELEVVSGPKPAGGFTVQPRRWGVERTNGWINRSRRLVRQYETTVAAHEGFLILSQIALLLRRLDRGQLFDRR